MSGPGSGIASGRKTQNIVLVYAWVGSVGVVGYRILKGKHGC